MRLLGIDTGGTFTDFVYFDGETLQARKVLSTPEAPEAAVLQGIRELAISLAGLHIIHGSTVATNAVLEGKGARVVYVANRGLGDVLTIGRQARRALYDLQPEPPPPPVPADLCLETGGRLDANGAVVEALTEEDIAVLLGQIHELGAESVAVNLLFSFVDDQFERQIARRLPPGLFASISSQVLPEYKEYERGIATWLNAYVGPLVAGYLDKMAARTRPASLSIMRSSGDACGANQAGREAVHLLLSGPAGGLTGARHCAGQIGVGKCMTFDMGGTSTDVALIDGDIALTNGGRIGPYPVAVPMVDMHSIGAGGGSIAYADAGGGLQVGPQSAGARPGPACYDQGGTLPTVTDANLLLGRLPPFTRLGGTLALNGDKARQALAGLAAELGLATAEQAADGVVALANEHITQALRLISVQRGIDPRDFVLVAFGGAGGLHVCALAEALEMRRALVPARAGALSAFGMLAAPAGRQYSKTLAVLLEAVAAEDINLELARLRERGLAELAEQGLPAAALRPRASLDLRYRGQSSTLNLEWENDIKMAAARFHQLHRARYGHQLDNPVELVNARLGLRASPPVLPLPAMPEAKAPGDAASREETRVHGCAEPVPLLSRGRLTAPAPGPFIVCDPDATVFAARGWSGRIDQQGNIALEKS